MALKSRNYLKQCIEIRHWSLLTVEFQGVHKWGASMQLLWIFRIKQLSSFTTPKLMDKKIRLQM